MDTPTMAAAIDPTMLALLSIFGGAVLAFLGGLVGAWIQGRREHRRWVREKRFDAHLAFLKLVDKYQQRHQNKLAGPNLRKKPEVLAELNEAVSTLALLGPEEFIEQADGLRLALAAFLVDKPNADSEFTSARAAYIQATRQVVKI